MPNNLTLETSPAQLCPHPIRWCGLRLCFTASDYTAGTAANAFVQVEMDLDTVPWNVGSTFTFFGITFTVVSGAPNGPNQVASSTNPATQWSNFYNALLSGITGGGQPITDYYSISGGFYITITAISPGSNNPSPSGFFSGGVVLTASGNGASGVTKTGYHVILDLYKQVGNAWQKVCGQYAHTYILPIQETSGGGNGVCFDISGALSVQPTPPPTSGHWYVQANAIGIYYAAFASFYRNEENPCGNDYSAYDQTDPFRVVNAVFNLSDEIGFAPYCPASSGAETQLITAMPLDMQVCCNTPIWWSLYFDPDIFPEPVSLEYLVESVFAGGLIDQQTLPIGSAPIAVPTWFTFLANPTGCALPTGAQERAFVRLELDEPDWALGSTLTLFGITLTVVNGIPGTNQLNPDANPAQQMTNLYNALLAAEISPGVAFTSLYTVATGFYITITAINAGYNPPGVIGNFGGGVQIDGQADGGGTGELRQVTVTVKEVGGSALYAPRTLRFKPQGDCCCQTHLYFVSELGNIDYIEGACTSGIDLEIDATTTGKPELCGDFVDSGVWEVNNASREAQTCYITVKPSQERYIRSFLKSVNKFWFDTETQKYYRITPAQKKYTLRRGDERVFIEFSFYVSYNLPNQLN